MPQFRHERSDNAELKVWGGIVSATVSDYADALGCDPAAIVQAVEGGHAEPLFDTAVEKGKRGKPENRPTDPELRSMGFTEGQFEALRRAVDEGAHSPEAERIPPERRGEREIPA